MSSLLAHLPAVHFDLPAYLDQLETVDLIPVSAAPHLNDRDDNEIAGVPLDEWLIAQAAWWKHHAEETGSDASAMTAGLINRIARSVRFHRCNTVTELLSCSPLYRRADLDAIETPPREERRLSALARDLDMICDDMLVESGIAARLVAWSVLDMAYDADFYHADTFEEFNDARAAFEAACEADSLEIAF